jgi:hypothetical protein
MIAHRAEEGPAGAVVLDIGGHIGAAVIYVPAGHEGEEMEIRQPPDDWDGSHTGVRRRRLAGRSACAAVFESLPAGRYEVRLRGETLGLDVQGGRVSEAHWDG